MQQGHREKKKQEQRNAIIAQSRVLFTKKGYKATTVADIAMAANCAPRTFFQYFTSKEDLLLVELDEVWDSLARALAARPANKSTLQALKGWVIAADAVSHDSLISSLLNEESASYLSVVARQKLYSMDKLETILTREFAKDLALSLDDYEPRMLAVAAAALFDALHTNASLAKGDKLAYIKKAIRLLEGAQSAVPRS